METAIATSKELLTSHVENVFVLAVKEGNFVNLYHVVANDLQDAILKSKRYCELAGTKRRFIHVRPFLTDLDKKHEMELKST